MSEQESERDTDKTAQTTVLTCWSLTLEPQQSAENNPDSQAFCDLQIFDRKPYSQPEITGFLLILLWYNPSGFIEQLYGTMYNIKCIMMFQGVIRTYVNPSNYLFLWKTTHNREWAIPMSLIINIKIETLAFMYTQLTKWMSLLLYHLLWWKGSPINCHSRQQKMLGKLFGQKQHTLV